MWIPALLLWILNISRLCSGQDFIDFYHAGDMVTETPELSDDQPILETVTSVDQLLQLLYPEYSLLQHCLRKKSWRMSSAFPPFPDSAANAFHSTDDDLWGQPREEALHKMDETLEVILEEMKRTSCQPREVCVEVTKEYRESTSHFYIPRCVSLHRCGGCCTSEAFYCTNTSYALVNKTLMELSPPRMDRQAVMVTFINHTSCECISKRPLHSIIRRAATDHMCSQPEFPCASGSLWDPINCGCVSTDAINYSQTGLWMKPLASVSVETDSPKTAVAQAGNWTTQPVNASVKVKVRVGCVPQASDGMRSCAAVYVLYSVCGINPSTPTPARVSVERVFSRVCGRARSSTPTLAAATNCLAGTPGQCARLIFTTAPKSASASPTT
ncbi:vascular endothelial growth factor C-like isoform X2 [Takifugu flavidus]|uniref:vascular endothelial growth factor C-like isoform X2 n=1 Tax=Takifugu flavidus TaxID=433684 RepID=UPI0025441B6C|nr:vascular endothelial growth factor C-like isoform X2 [Takifugu flavidus]